VSAIIKLVKHEHIIYIGEQFGGLHSLDTRDWS